MLDYYTFPLMFLGTYLKKNVLVSILIHDKLYNSNKAAQCCLCFVWTRVPLKMFYIKKLNKKNKKLLKRHIRLNY